MLPTDVQPFGADQGCTDRGGWRQQHVPFFKQGVDLVAIDTAKALCAQVPGRWLQCPGNEPVDGQRLEVLRDQIRREPEYMKFNEAFVKMAAQVDDMWQAIGNAITDGPSVESLRGEG